MAGVPHYNYKSLNLSSDSVPKNGVEIFLEYFGLFSSTAHDPGMEPSPLASPRRPLPIDVPIVATGPKMEKLEKKEKLKNRDLIQNPFII